jgi:hypothetical protein
LEELRSCFPQCWKHFTSPSTVYQGCILSTCSSTLAVKSLFIAISISVKCYLIVICMCMSLMVNDAEHLSMSFYWLFVCFLWRNVHSDIFLISQLGYFFHYWVTIFLHILEIRPLYDFSNFPHSMKCLFTFFMVSFELQMLLLLIMSICLLFLLIFLPWESFLRNHCLMQHQKDLCLYFFKVFFIVLAIAFSLWSIFS